ncbi:type II toxin-antitoxin system RelE family toxin [Nostoc sp.]|uniref:type II toxin-antitoxin system RelE family toxin n=1 Tax=Nostoc sp. TaxID=1180 RepID=UPI003FA5AC97
MVISKSVQKQIDNLPNDVALRVIEKMQNLVSEPRPDGIVKLKGSDNEYVSELVIIEFVTRLMMKVNSCKFCSASIGKMFIEKVNAKNLNFILNIFN